MASAVHSAYREKADNPLVSSRIMPRVDAVLPMPDIRTMLALIGRLAG